MEWVKAGPLFSVRFARGRDVWQTREIGEPARAFALFRIRFLKPSSLMFSLPSPPPPPALSSVQVGQRSAAGDPQAVEGPGPQDEGAEGQGARPSSHARHPPSPSSSPASSPRLSPLALLLLTSLPFPPFLTSSISPPVPPTSSPPPP
jgi:hypothetical protein